jgi:hypothetical protein
MRALLFLILSSLLLPGYYREHAEFKPAEVEKMALKLIHSIKINPAWGGRRIQERKSQFGVDIQRDKEGLLTLTIDVSYQRKEKETDSLFAKTTGKHRTLLFRPIEKPAFEWQLGEEIFKELELLLRTEAFWAFHLKNEIQQSPTGKVLSSRSQIVAKFYGDETAAKAAALFFSKHDPKATLWEDNS